MLTKEWDWKNVSERDIWLEPCEESYYYILKWKHKGYKNVLDLGCGLGRHSILFAQSGFDVTAVDLSEYGINHLNEWRKKENVDILTKVCNMNDLPFDNDSFDCIWAHHVLSHSDTDGMYKIMSEIERVLKPSGTIYFDLNSKETWRFAKSNFPRLDKNTVLVQGGIEDGVPHFCVDMDDIEMLLKSFTIIKVRHIDDCWFNGSRQLSKHYFIEAVKID